MATSHNGQHGLPTSTSIISPPPSPPHSGNGGGFGSDNGGSFGSGNSSDFVSGNNASGNGSGNSSPGHVSGQEHDQQIPETFNYFLPVAFPTNQLFHY